MSGTTAQFVVRMGPTCDVAPERMASLPYAASLTRSVSSGFVAHQSTTYAAQALP